MCLSAWVNKKLAYCVRQVIVNGWLSAWNHWIAQIIHVRIGHLRANCKLQKWHFQCLKKTSVHRISLYWLLKTLTNRPDLRARDSSVSFLTGRIPDLSFDGLVVHADRPCGKLHTDRTLTLQIKLIPGKPAQQVGFPYTRVTNEYHWGWGGYLYYIYKEF